MLLYDKFNQEPSGITIHVLNLLFRSLYYEENLQRILADEWLTAGRSSSGAKHPPEQAGDILLMIETLHYLKDPKLWGIMVYSLLWAMQDFYHQPHYFAVVGK